MNTHFPKRLINFVSICTLLICVLGIAWEVGHLRMESHNLSQIDVQSSYLYLGLSSLIIIGCISAFKSKTFGWICIVSYMLYSMGTYGWNKLSVPFDRLMLVYEIPILLVLVAALYFFFTTATRVHFGVGISHLMLAIFLPLVASFGLSMNPVENTERMNAYYLDRIEGAYYYDGKAYTGEIFTNHTNGVLKNEGAAIDSRSSGQWRYYFDNGILRKTENYVDGNLNGKVLSYYSDGTLNEEFFFTDGVLDGEYKLWYENKIELSGRYREGLMDGEWREYDGDLIKIEKYRLDTLISTEYINVE